MHTQDALARKVEAEGAPDTAPPPGPDRVTVETRFGTYEFDRASAISMPHGVPGFPDRRSFGLTDLPSAKLEQFKLFQSLDDPDPGFVVLPLPLDNSLLDGADVHAALETLAIAAQDAALLLVVSARREGEEVTLSINLRAPIFLDTGRRVGRQYVLPSVRYQVRHDL